MHVFRVTATTYVTGVSHQQVTIEDTFGEQPAYAYAVGKSKFSQGIDGVQTVHEYEASTEEGKAVQVRIHVTVRRSCQGIRLREIKELGR